MPRYKREWSENDGAIFYTSPTQLYAVCFNKKTKDFILIGSAFASNCLLSIENNKLVLKKENFYYEICKIRRTKENLKWVERINKWSVK